MPESADAPIAALTTFGTAAQAKAFVRRLVDDRVIACGSVVNGVASVYRWDGAIEESEEVLVILKTRAGRWEQLRTAIAEHHPYDLPELLRIPIADGTPEYVGWLRKETTGEYMA